MKIQEIMTRDVKVCRPETNLAEAVKLMWERDCGVLPVVKSDGKVSGMITDRDICIAIATRGQTADQIAVSDVTVGKAYTCAPDDDATVALQTMKSQRVRRLPVVDAEGRLKGILSLNDVVTHAGAASSTEIVSTIASICEHGRRTLLGIHHMENKKTAAFGIYSSALAAERAVDALVQAGFSHSAVSALLPNQQGTNDFAHEKHTKAPEGTTTGVATGGVLGGTLGLLAGIGALAIPGVGPFIAAGPIMGALAGLGVGGAVGGLIGALVGMGIPEYEAKRYEGHLKKGGVLLSVHCDTADQITRAKGILTGTGAADIASTDERRSSESKQLVTK
jgi:CBS domain-containing protein